jgi:hypothetical protein
MPPAKEEEEEAVKAGQEGEEPPPPLNYRLRTITAFVELRKVDRAAVAALQAAAAEGGASTAAVAEAADAEALRLWGASIAEAGDFLARAKEHFEEAIPGLEVQTVRAASQDPMCEVFRAAAAAAEETTTTMAAKEGGAAKNDPRATAPVRPSFPSASESLVAILAAALERLAHSEGVPMLSLGAIVDDETPALRHVPAVLEATTTVSCSFEALWRHSSAYETADYDCDRNRDYEDEEAYAAYSPAALRLAAEVKLEVARRTNGHGNFRFGIAAGCNADGSDETSENGWRSRIKREPCGCGIRKYRRRRERAVAPALGPVPFFPVAGGRPGGNHATYFALGCETDGLLRIACERVRAAFDAAAHEGEGGSGRPGDRDVRAASAGLVTGTLKRVLAEELSKALNPLRNAALEFDAGERAYWEGKEEEDDVVYSAPWGFCGVDTSLAPGLDTPSLTGSFELLLPLLHTGRGSGPSSSSSSSCPAPRFGDAGTLALCSAVTRALQSDFWERDKDNPDDDIDEVPAEPPTTTGYRGLMLAVLEDQGLAEAASEGRLSIGRLLSWSSVCGTGLDTVPIPGPRWRVKKEEAAKTGAAAVGDKRRRGVKKEGEDQEVEEEDEAAKRHDAELAGTIAAVAADVCTMALRLRKPLSVRLLPLPMLKAGDETRTALGGHPYLLDSRVMAL